MARIICLANSKKGGGRCIAGIDLSTELWVRPIGRGHEGAIGNERFINNCEPQLLDVLEIPLGGLADDHGCQPENRRFGTSRWKISGTISKEKALSYAEDTKLILHNNQRKVDPDIFKTLPKSSWKSLQLIYVSDANFKYIKKWDRSEVSFTYSNRKHKIKITDLLIIDRLKKDKSINHECLLSVSLAAPYQAKCDDKPFCYKMVAGVIELD